MAETKRSRRAAVLVLSIALACAAAGAVLVICLSPGDGGNPPPGNAAESANLVVVEVAGTPIRENDLLKGIPGGLFGITRERALKTRLTRLAQNAVLRKFVLDNQISVPEEQVVKEFYQIQSDPTSISCPCCQAGNTFEDLLRKNFYTADDVKNELRNRIGLAQYLETYWETDGKNTGRPKGELLNEKLGGIMMWVNVSANKVVKEWSQKNAAAAP